MADNAAPLILLTRPRAQSDRFAALCRAEFGSRAEILAVPLQEIVPTGEVPDIEGVAALIFTSENGVRIFAETCADRSRPAWCVGPRTAEAAAAEGFAARDGGGSAEALVGTILAAPDDGPLLHLHGRHTRGDVAGKLAAAGRRATGIAVYDQRAIPPARALAPLGAGRPVLVPLFSPRSAALFASALGPAAGDWRCLCLSEAVAEALPAPLRAAAEVAASPEAGAMVSALARHIYT